MRILVAGGAAFIGSHLVDRLLQRDDVDHLVMLDNLWTGRLANFEHIGSGRPSFIKGDAESHTLSWSCRDGSVRRAARDGGDSRL